MPLGRHQAAPANSHRSAAAGYRLSAFTLWLLALLLLASLANAQPTDWQSYKRGSTTYYSGTDANGGQWTGSSYERWGKRFYEFTAPDGQTQRCSAYALPGAGNKECWP
jgi:hypothetical protein